MNGESEAAAIPGGFELFVGEDMAGTWQICAGDAGHGDEGSIETVVFDIGGGCDP